MINLELSLKQMSWANQKLLGHLLELPDEAWRAKVAPDEWHVAALVFHLVASTDWYTYQLGKPLRFTDESESITEVRQLGGTWLEFDKILIDESHKEDGKVFFLEDGKEFSADRSTILSQAVIHSVEHRVQIASALLINGFDFPELEDFSVWGYIYNLEQIDNA